MTSLDDGQIDIVEKRLFVIQMRQMSTFVDRSPISVCFPYSLCVAVVVCSGGNFLFLYLFVCLFVLNEGVGFYSFVFCLIVVLTCFGFVIVNTLSNLRKRGLFQNNRKSCEKGEISSLWVAKSQVLRHKTLFS